MGIRRLFYVGGIIPTILGGGISGWWFGKDKTIEDALRRIGKVPFKTQAEFEKVYEKYKDSDGFKSNIPDARSWEDISKWCETKLRLELNEENIKKVFDKVLRYCTEFEEAKIESKKLPNFGGLMSTIKDNTEKGSVQKRTSILSFAYNGNYYCAYDVNDINNETRFEKCPKPEKYYSLYVEQYKPLNLRDNVSERWSKWSSMLDRYLDNNENPLGIDLVSVSVGSTDSDARHIVVKEKNNSQNRNALISRCDSLLKEKFTSEEKYKKGLIDFVTWCTETGLNDNSLKEFRLKRNSLSQQ